MQNESLWARWMDRRSQNFGPKDGGSGGDGGYVINYMARKLGLGGSPQKAEVIARLRQIDLTLVVGDDDWEPR